MQAAKTSLLIINSGSSSIKFSFYTITDLTKQILYGELENNGAKNARLHFNDTIANQK
jgi:acetate kinase